MTDFPVKSTICGSIQRLTDRQHDPRRGMGAVWARTKLLCTGTLPSIPIPALALEGTPCHANTNPAVVTACGTGNRSDKNLTLWSSWAMEVVVSGDMKCRATAFSVPTRSRAAKKLQGSVAPMRFMHQAHNGQNAGLAATMGTSDQSQ